MNIDTMSKSIDNNQKKTEFDENKEQVVELPALDFFKINFISF